MGDTAWAGNGDGAGAEAEAERLPQIVVSDLCYEAVVPYKADPRDVGLCITLVRHVRNLHPTVSLFSTGLKVRPPPGYHLEVLPRWKIAHTHFSLATAGTHTDELMVAVRRPCIHDADLDIHDEEQATLFQVVARRNEEVGVTLVPDA